VTSTSSTSSPQVITQQIIPEDIETTDEIVVAQVVREISCDETCIDSIRKRAQVSDGKVFVSVNGGERFEVTARNPIPIDSNSTSLSFTVVDDKGNQTEVLLPITRTTDAGSPLGLICWFGLLLIILDALNQKRRTRKIITS
jgi:hypothetical protein